MQSHFIETNEHFVDINSQPLFAYNAAARWYISFIIFKMVIILFLLFKRLGIRLEVMCNLVVTIVALFCIIEKDTINPGNFLSLFYSSFRCLLFSFFLVFPYQNTGLAGLSLSYVLVLTNMLNIMVRTVADSNVFIQ